MQGYKTRASAPAQCYDRRLLPIFFLSSLTRSQVAEAAFCELQRTRRADRRRPRALSLCTWVQSASRLVARVGVTTFFTFLKASPRDSGRPLPLFPWPGGGTDIVLDDPALKLEGHLSVLAARAAAVHPTASTGYAHRAYVSAPPRPEWPSCLVPWPG